MRIYTDEELVLRNKGLQEIKGIFAIIKLPFFLVDGVLLGAVREKNFIKWDWDVELVVFSEIAIEFADNIIHYSKSSGFNAEYVDDSFKNFKINLHKYDTKYSIVGLYKKRKYRLRNAFKYPAKYFDKPISIKFLGEDYLAPNPIDDFLVFLYGENWRTPKMSSIKKEYLSRDVFNNNRFNIIERMLEKISSLINNKKD